MTHTLRKFLPNSFHFIWHETCRKPLLKSFYLLWRLFANHEDWVKVLETGLQFSIDGHLINSELFRIQTNVFQVVSRWHQCQLNETNDGFGLEVDASQRNNLVQHLEWSPHFGVVATLRIVVH